MAEIAPHTKPRRHRAPPVGKARRDLPRHLPKGRSGQRHPDPSASGTRTTAPLIVLAGGALELSHNVPLELGPPPLTAARRLIGRALLARDPKLAAFQTPMTEFEAACTIDAALSGIIQQALAPLKYESWPISVRIFHDEEGTVTLLVAPQDACNLAPEWTKNRKVPGAIKQAVWNTLKEAVPAILPVGDFEYLMEEASGYYWDGATTDEEAIEALQNMGYDEGTAVLPSELRKAAPRWLTAKYKSKRKMPRDIAKAIALTKRRLREFKKLPARHSAWQPDYEIAANHDHGYDDCASTPPFFLVPLERPILDILDIVAEGAMQVGFFDVAGAATLSKPSQINAWLDSFAAGIRLLAAIDQLISASPFRTPDA